MRWWSWSWPCGRRVCAPVCSPTTCGSSASVGGRSCLTRSSSTTSSTRTSAGCASPIPRSMSWHSSVSASWPPKRRFSTTSKPTWRGRGRWVCTLSWWSTTGPRRSQKSAGWLGSALVFEQPPDEHGGELVVGRLGSLDQDPASPVDPFASRAGLLGDTVEEALRGQSHCLTQGCRGGYHVTHYRRYRRDFAFC